MNAWAEMLTGVTGLVGATTSFLVGVGSLVIALRKLPRRRRSGKRTPPPPARRAWVIALPAVLVSCGAGLVIARAGSSFPAVFLGGVLILVGAFGIGIQVLRIEIQRRRAPAPPGHPEPPRPAVLGNLTIVALCAGVLLLVGTGRSFPSVFGPRTEREIALRHAFIAFENGHWDQTILNAEKVISEHRGDALLEQEQLEREHAPPPTVGKIPNDARETVFARGLLNDVGASYFIKGRALEQLHRIAEARQCYFQSSQLTYARTYDPRQEIFWAPAEASLGRLRSLPD